MLLLPAEVALHILTFVPLSSYRTLYQVFSQELVDEALKCKARKQSIELVSTNLHELTAAYNPSCSKLRNESGLSLTFLAYDSLHRVIWFTPDFNSANHYFKVKDGFVSHGKLIVRANKESPSKVIMSLWDIRKKLPPKRSGTLSGASQIDYREYTEELSIRDQGFILEGLIATCKSDDQLKKRWSHRAAIAGSIPPPISGLVPSYTQLAVEPASPWERHFPNPSCGVFLVEGIAFTVPTFLDLFI
jgi:hypothetical protein